VKLSLGTREPRIALQLARILAYLGARLLDDSLGGTVRYDEIRALLKDHFTRLLDEKKEAIGANGRLSGFERDVLKSSIETADYPEMFNLPLEGLGTPVDRLIEQYGLEASPGGKTYETLQAELQRSYKSYCQDVLNFDQSLEQYDFSTPPQVAVDTVERDGTTLSELITTFVAERVRGGNWTPRTEKENRAFYALLCKMVGDATPAGAVDYPAARTVKDLLQKVPRNLNTNPLTQNLTLEEAIALDGAKVMQVKTINKHLGAYNALFKWAAENGYVEKNVFAGSGIKRGKSQPPSRVAFTNDQMEALLRTVIGNERGLIKKDYQRWGPLIGMYTGARLNEIAQLRPADIRQEDGIWCFDINERDEGKRLKTASATRLIPVHPKLLDLGLLDYRNKARTGEAPRLLDELGYSEGTGYGRNLSRWFNGPFLKALGMNDQSLVFHSLRHTMVTNLLQSDVAGPLVSSIVGHAQKGVTHDVYFGKGYTVAQKKEALERLSWS
jgi:integrase